LKEVLKNRPKNFSISPIDYRMRKIVDRVSSGWQEAKTEGYEGVFGLFMALFLFLLSFASATNRQREFDIP